MDSSLATKVIDALRNQGATVATCESITAGLISATLATVPGASDVLRGGLITYATDAKIAVAGLSQELIDAHGVVSPAVAEELAKAAREKLGSTWGIGITGVAGPTSQDGHPVGTVWLGLAGPHGAESARVLPTGGTRWALRADAAEPEEVVDGDRNGIRLASATFALEQLRARLSA